MKAVVVHHLWSGIGGEELVNMYIVKTLINAEYDVSIVSVSNFNREKYEKWFNLDLSKIRVYSFLPLTLPSFSLYQMLGVFIPLKNAIKKEKPDLIFIDNEFYKPILKMRNKKFFRILEYIHFIRFPLNLLKDSINVMPREYKKILEEYSFMFHVYHEKYEKGMWKLYFKNWLKMYSWVARENPFESADIVMTNSHYIAKIIKAIWGGDAIVLYPPVKIDDFDPHMNIGFDERDNAIVMIGRISPEKRIEDVIDAIALTETKPMLRVIGGLVPSAVPYKNKLLRRASKKKVKVCFHVNAPRRDLIKIAALSKIFVHATRGEHFGISVVEGMAAGCPVIVHASGGPYVDITDYGRYGLVYKDLEDLAGKIDLLISDRKEWEYYHRASIERSRMFRAGEFERNLLKILNTIWTRH